MQFNHRYLAITTLGLVGATLVRARSAAVWSLLPRQARLALASMGAAAVGQVTLGISTLMLYVPIPLAVCHQGGSLVLLSTALWSAHALRYAKVLEKPLRAAPKAA